VVSGTAALRDALEKIAALPLHVNGGTSDIAAVMIARRALALADTCPVCSGTGTTECGSCEGTGVIL
jgi:hypothetical protein